MSCGTEGDKLQHVVGHDGHMYRSGKPDDGFTSTMKHGGIASYATHAGTTVRESHADKQQLALESVVSRNNAGYHASTSDAFNREEQVVG